MAIPGSLAAALRACMIGVVTLTVLLPNAEARRPRHPHKLSKQDAKANLEFAAKMAQRGLWKEALFRWERVLEARPDDARLWNNIAVAREAMGDFEGAKAAYDRALALDGDDRIIANQSLFLRSAERAGASDAGDESKEDGSP